MKNDNILTQKDIIRIITCLNLNYTENFSNYGEEELKQLADYWYESLKKYPRDLVLEAVRRAIEKSEFIPKLSTIIKEIDTIRDADTPTDEQLWAELTAVLAKAFDVSRYLSYPQYYNWANDKLKEIYDGFSEELKMFVVNTSTLIELAEMPAENLQYERARFFKQMPALKKRMADSQSADKFLTTVNKTAELEFKNNENK